MGHWGVTKLERPQCSVISSNSLHVCIVKLALAIVHRWLGDVIRLMFLGYKTRYAHEVG